MACMAHACTSGRGKPCRCSTQRSAVRPCSRGMPCLGHAQRAARMHLRRGQAMVQGLRQVSAARERLQRGQAMGLGRAQRAVRVHLRRGQAMEPAGGAREHEAPLGQAAQQPAAAAARPRGR